MSKDRRTLIYVPMKHMLEEAADVSNKGLRLLRENMNGRKIAYKDFVEALDHWHIVTADVVSELAVTGCETFDLFSESWVHHRQIAAARASLKDDIEYFSGAHSFLARMLSIGGVPHLTESARDLRLADRAMSFENRLRQRHPQVRPPRLINDEIVSRRDRDIAARLQEVVSPGRIAVLCVGAAHDVPAYLDNSWDIDIVTTPELYVIAEAAGHDLRWMEIYRENC